MKCSPVLLVCVSGLAICASAQQKPSSPPAQSKSAKPAVAAPQRADDSQSYRNAVFGFRYRVPFGWVDRTKEMQGGSEAGPGEILLTVFERPPQAAGEKVNSAVVIAAEPASSYPGLKTAADYLGPLNEVTAAKGFKPAGDPAEMAINGRTLVQADFTNALSDKLTMHQTTLVILAKGQILTFTFIAGSEDEVYDLIDNLSFAGPGSKPH